VHAMNQAGDAVSSPVELDQNIAAYDAALKLRPEDILMRRGFLELLDQRGDFDREVQEAQQLVNTPPPRSQSKLRYGDALLHDGRVREAIPVYREVIRLRPDESDPRQALGDALLQTGAEDDALAAYRAAEARGDDTPEFHNNLAMLLMKKGDLNGAGEHLQRALQWTQNPIWQANLGGLYYRQGKYEAALEQFGKALSGMSDSPALRDNIGLTLMALGRKQAAANQFEEALRIDPNYSQARAHLQQLVNQR
jgi:Flp pilus assembly protein TadD